jgi:hypothetical protein
MIEYVKFESQCPQCRQQRLQAAYTQAELRRLLSYGRPVEAFCPPCDQFWAVSVEERVALAKTVLPGYDGPSYTGGDAGGRRLFRRSLH